MDDGDGSAAMQIYLRFLHYRLKNGYNGTFYVVYKVAKKMLVAFYTHCNPLPLSDQKLLEEGNYITLQVRLC